MTDLKTAQRAAQEGTNATFGIQRTGTQMSFIVPAELAAGTFVEFVQQEPPACLGAPSGSSLADQEVPCAWITAHPDAVRRAHLFLAQPRIKPLRENTR